MCTSAQFSRRCMQSVVNACDVQKDFGEREQRYQSLLFVPRIILCKIWMRETQTLVWNSSLEIFIRVCLPFQMFICCLCNGEGNWSMQIFFQMIQFPRLFINRVNWILRMGLLGEGGVHFCTLKYSFEITPFDSGVKDRLIDKMINRKHDK